MSTALLLGLCMASGSLAACPGCLLYALSWPSGEQALPNEQRNHAEGY